MSDFDDRSSDENREEFRGRKSRISKERRSDRKKDREAGDSDAGPLFCYVDDPVPEAKVYPRAEATPSATVPDAVTDSGFWGSVKEAFSSVSDAVCDAFSSLKNMLPDMSSDNSSHHNGSGHADGTTHGSTHTTGGSFFDGFFGDGGGGGGFGGDGGCGGDGGGGGGERHGMNRSDLVKNIGPLGLPEGPRQSVAHRNRGRENRLMM